MPEGTATPTPNILPAEMEGYVARFQNLHGSEEAFVDSRLPGARRFKINLIGMGVVERAGLPELRPNIPLPAIGFNLGMIQCDPATYRRLSDRFDFHEPQTIYLKGKGDMTVYRLIGRKS